METVSIQQRLGKELESFKRVVKKLLNNAMHLSKMSLQSEEMNMHYRHLSHLLASKGSRSKYYSINRLQKWSREWLLHLLSVYKEVWCDQAENKSIPSLTANKPPFCHNTGIFYEEQIVFDLKFSNLSRKEPCFICLMCFLLWLRSYWKMIQSGCRLNVYEKGW